MARLLECADANSDPLHVCVCEGALRERLAKMLTAVSDTEKENPPLWGMGVVATAIAVNFFGSLAQKELKVMIIDDYPDSSQTLLTFGLALLQILSAVLVFQSSSISFSGSPTNREAAILATFAHAGWLYLTSYRLWGQDTGASVSYGALEPIFCILLLCIAAGIPTELSKVGAVAAICLGTGMMTADFSILIDKTALIRIIAALFCLSRNMIIKHLYDSNVKISLRGQNTLLSVLASGTVTAVLFGLAVSSTMVVPAMIIVVSCLLSVVSLHLTFMLLSLYDNTTAVVFMLWAQVVDTVVFVSSVSRPDILLIPVGAVLFALGHYYYFKDGVESGTIHLNMKRVGVNEMITRLQFVLYACSIIALLAIVFQPKLSERDINILSYVGLDRIARKLLSLSADHQ